MSKGSCAARRRPHGGGLTLWLAVSQLPLLAAAQPAASQRPEEIVVTPSLIPQSKRQIGTAVSTIDFEEIALRGYTDVADVLRTQPGIGVSNSGGLGKHTILRIRGEEGYRTLLVIDGIKAVDPSVPQAAPSFDSLLATSDLQRIEVLRGPQGFIYGADAGGVINVMTKRGEDGLGAEVGLEYGEYATRKIDHSRRSARVCSNAGSFDTPAAAIAWCKMMLGEPSRFTVMRSSGMR